MHAFWGESKRDAPPAPNSIKGNMSPVAKILCWYKSSVHGIWACKQILGLPNACLMLLFLWEKGQRKLTQRLRTSFRFAFQLLSSRITFFIQAQKLKFKLHCQTGLTGTRLMSIRWVAKRIEVTAASRESGAVLQFSPPNLHICRSSSHSWCFCSRTQSLWINIWAHPIPLAPKVCRFAVQGFETWAQVSMLSPPVFQESFSSCVHAWWFQRSVSRRWPGKHIWAAGLL